jgi:hypothetical protein
MQRGSMNKHTTIKRYSSAVTLTKMINKFEKRGSMQKEQRRSLPSNFWNFGSRFSKRVFPVLRNELDTSVGCG